MKCVRDKMIIMVPYPAQGHVTPMLKLASVLVKRGLKPVVVIPEFLHRRMQQRQQWLVPLMEMEMETMAIPDGLDDLHQDANISPDFFAIDTAMENNMPRHLEQLIRRLDNNYNGILCVVVDLLASWAIKVAVQFHHVQVAGFWPCMLATYTLVAAIPQLVYSGIISETGTPQSQAPICFQPGQPIMTTEDLPWLIGNSASRNLRFKFWMRTMERSKTLRWLLVNTFPEEYNSSNIINEATKYLDDSVAYRSPLVLPVGPLTLSEINEPITKKFCSFWKEEDSCLDWLDKQRPGSVVYVSFGSWVSPIGEEKLKNLALALQALGEPFLWVLKPEWRKGLPVCFLERALSSSNKQAAALGKVISWAPQVQVLQHRAVRCFLTHCGWNSIVEAIQCMKPLLCCPIAGDQFVNCAYVVKLWRVGIRLYGFGARDVEECLKKVKSDTDIDVRLLKLHDTIMGKNSKTNVMANLTAFIDDLNESTC